MVFDRPTAFELLDSVSVFLEEKIKGELPKHLAFNVQIAINVINIVLIMFFLSVLLVS